MKVTTLPFVAADGAPLVSLKLGGTAVELSATQAEDIAMALFRAASAARYESGLRETLGSDAAEETVTLIRASMDRRKVRKN